MYFICRYKKHRDIVAKYLTFRDMWSTIREVIIDRHVHGYGNAYTFYNDNTFLFGINGKGEIEFDVPD